MRAPRADRATPRPRNSASRYPSPTPSVKRPSERTSVTAALSAISTGRCSGSSSTYVPMRSRVVRCAIAPARGKTAGR